MVVGHFLGPSLWQFSRAVVGCMAPGYAPDAGRLHRPDDDARIILRAHIEKARRAAAQHLGNPKKSAPIFVLIGHMRVKRLGPVKHPRAGVEIVGKHGA